MHTGCKNGGQNHHGLQGVKPQSSLLLCSCTVEFLLVCAFYSLDPSKNVCMFFACWGCFWHVYILFCPDNQPSATMVHQLVNNPQKRKKLRSHFSHFTTSTLQASFCLDQYHAACIRPPTLARLQTSLFPYHATQSLQSVSSVWPFNLSTKAPKPHLCQNKEARSITTQCGRSSPGMGRTQK